LNSSSEEEAKEAPQTPSVKYDNSRSITQAKKNKKTNQISKRMGGGEEAVVDTTDTKIKECVPLQKDILKMIGNKEFSDVTLIIDEKEIYAHRAVLSSRSTYFDAMFSNDFREADKSKIVLKGVSSYDLFYNLIEFMYSD